MQPQISPALAFWVTLRSDQIRSVAQSCLTLCNPMNRSTPGLPVHHQLPELTQTHVHRVGDAIQPSHPVVSFSSCPQSLPASASFPMSQLFAWGGQSTGVSALASFLPKNSCIVVNNCPICWNTLLNCTSHVRKVSLLYPEFFLLFLLALITCLN